MSLVTLIFDRCVVSLPGLLLTLDDIVIVSIINSMAASAIWH